MADVDMKISISSLYVVLKKVVNLRDNYLQLSDAEFHDDVIKESSDLKGNGYSYNFIKQLMR